MEIKTRATELLKKHISTTDLSYLGNNEPLWDDLVGAVSEALSLPVVVSVKELRSRFLKDIPRQVIKGEQLSYTDLLEEFIINNCVVSENDLLPDTSK